jgi:hypothetical protein
LPDFNGYEGVNYGTMGKAFLPYEETEQYLNNTKALNAYKDSVAILKQLIASGDASSKGEYKTRMERLNDSVNVKTETINSDKRNYVPEQLFKLTHAYKVKEKSGIEKTTEEAFYFDKNFKKIVKVEKIY